MTPPSGLFEEQGYLRLPGFHPRARVDRVRKALLRELERRKIWDGARPLSKTIQKLPAFQQIARISGALEIAELHETLVTPDLLARVTALAGGAVLSAQEAQLLVSLPHQGAWTLQGLNWHVDVSTRDRLPGVQAFFLIDDVAPHGGATLALAGSHRRERQVALLEAAAGTGVVEMAGRAGDVFLMDMRVLHTPSINATGHVRMMATARFFIPA